jgi:hypothetical protein
MGRDRCVSSQTAAIALMLGAIGPSLSVLFEPASIHPYLSAAARKSPTASAPCRRGSCRYRIGHLRSAEKFDGR